MTARHQKVLQDIKKSFYFGHWNVKNYWFSPAPLRNSMTVTTPASMPKRCLAQDSYCILLIPGFNNDDVLLAVWRQSVRPWIHTGQGSSFHHILSSISNGVNLCMALWVLMLFRFILLITAPLSSNIVSWHFPENTKQGKNTRLPLS